MGGLGGDDAIATGAKAVHPRGQPISHSTNLGLSLRFDGRGEVVVSTEDVGPSGGV